MPEKNNTGNEAEAPTNNKDEPTGQERSPENWVDGVSSGIKGVSRKLLDQVPPEFREKVIQQARTHGPGAAAVIVNAAALKTRNLKAKLALKALGKILIVLDSKIPKKPADQGETKKL